MAKPISDAASTPATSPVRERIIEASADLFRQNGYDVSMDAIAQAADVSKQSLYNHFGSKEELFKSIVTLRSAAMRAPLTASGPDREPREVLLDVARQYYALAFNPRSMGFLRTIVSASQRFPDIGADFYDVGPKQTLEVLIEWMEREERLGRLNTRNPRLAAEHFLSLLLGHIQTRGLLGLETGTSEADLEERAAFCADAFMRAFGAPVNRA
ncbi:MAG: TetR/AcrR family transcriptional regulator [Micropepsaceae bacterium]